MPILRQQKNAENYNHLAIFVLDSLKSGQRIIYFFPTSCIICAQIVGAAKVGQVKKRLLYGVLYRKMAAACLLKG